MLFAVMLSAVSIAVGAESDPAILRGVQYLRGRAAVQKVGEAALIGLALIKADTPPTDPAVAFCVATIRRRLTSGVMRRSGGAGAIFTRRAWWRWFWQTPTRGHSGQT